MKISLPNTHNALCILAAAFLPCLHAQELSEEAASSSSLPEITGATLQGEAHEHIANIGEFIESRFSMIAIADPDRIYDPFGIVKDGDIELPKIEVIEPPVIPRGEDPTTPVTPAVNQLKTTVDSLVITGFNSGGGSILLGVNEISIGQLIPASDDIFLADVKPNQITFKSKASGKEYSRPVGFNPKGVQSRNRNDFLNSIEGVNRR